MNNLQKKSLEIARAMANFEGKRCFHLSLLFKGGKILCFAENSHKTSPRNKFNSPFVEKKTCSELRCFIAAKNKYRDLDWSKVTLINVRIAKDGSIKNSKLCNACHNLCVAYLGIRNIWHTNDEGKFVKYEN